MRRPLRKESANRILVVQLCANANEENVLGVHAAPLGLCDNLVNALKLLAIQQKDGVSQVQSKEASWTV